MEFLRIILRGDTFESPRRLRPVSVDALFAMISASGNGRSVNGTSCIRKTDYPPKMRSVSWNRVHSSRRNYGSTERACLGATVPRLRSPLLADSIIPSLSVYSRLVGQYKTSRANVARAPDHSVNRNSLCNAHRRLAQLTNIQEGRNIRICLTRDRSVYRESLCRLEFRYYISILASMRYNARRSDTQSVGLIRYIVNQEILLSVSHAGIIRDKGDQFGSTVAPG